MQPNSTKVKNRMAILKYLLVIAFLIICNVSEAQRWRGSKNRETINNGIEIGFVHNNTHSASPIHNYGPSIGVNWKSWHLDGAINCLEPYGKTRFANLVCKSKYDRKQYWVVNVGKSFCLGNDYRYTFFITPKVGCYYETDIYTSECFDVYTLMNEKYRVNFGVDISFYLRELRDWGMAFSVGGINYSFGVRIVKYMSF